jgi:hypothetical protein
VLAGNIKPLIFSVPADCHEISEVREAFVNSNHDKSQVLKGVYLALLLQLRIANVVPEAQQQPEFESESGLIRVSATNGLEIAILVQCVFETNRKFTKGEQEK